MSNLLFTNTVKAGRLLRMLGWVILAFALGVGIAFGIALAIPIFTALDAPMQSSLANALLRPMVPVAWMLAVAACFGIAFLIVGAYVKEYKPWAKVSGVLLALMSLIYVPIGTMIGCFVLFYLAKGWKERPTVTGL